MSFLGKEDGERVFVTGGLNEPIVIINMGVSIYTEDMLSKNLVGDIRNAFPSQKMFIADGEFVCLKGGFYDFLSDRHNLKDDTVGLKLWAFLSYPMTLETPYSEIKKYLLENVKQTERVSIVPYEILKSRQDIQDYFKKTSENYEGIVIKPNLGYNAKWLKMRKHYTQDVVILGIKKTDTWKKYNIPATFSIGVYDQETAIYKRIGDVSSGLTNTEKSRIGRVLLPKSTHADKDYVYVPPAVCLEIDYHDKTEKGLRFPKILRTRFDKRPEDCKLL